LGEGFIPIEESKRWKSKLMPILTQF
jgi:hypothetical protein